jgi:hypothetical protein
MGNCAKDISEKLLMALWLDEFPDEQPSIKEHLRNCPTCREELEMWRKFDTFIKEYKNELASAVSECPASDALVEFAMGDKSDPGIEGHLEYCYDCAEQVRLVRDLSREDLFSEDDSALSLEEKLIIKKAVSREYPDKQATAPSSIRQYLDKLIASFNIPSLALGAVAAALLLIFLVPQPPKEGPFNVVLSEVDWARSAESINKGNGLFQKPVKPGKKVAVVLLVTERDLLSQVDVDKIYRGLDFADDFGDTYEFISPAETKKALDDSKLRIGDFQGLTEQVFGKTDADYLLALKITKTDSRNAVVGTLFRRTHKDRTGTLSQTGLSMDRVPRRIKEIGTELLLEAERP